MTQPAERSASERELLALIEIFRDLGGDEPWGRLDRVVGHAARAVGAATGSLFLIRGHPRRLVASVIRGTAVSGSAPLEVQLGEAVPGWVAANDAALRLNDPQADPRFVPFAPDADPVSNLLCVPLRDDLGVSGVIELIDHPTGFTGAEEAVLVNIATEVAVLLRKARLLRELDRERLLQKQLLDINKTLVSALKLSDVLERIVDAVGRVVDFDAIGIFLCRNDGDIEEIVERGYARDKVHLLHQKVGQGLVGHVVSTGEALSIGDVREDPRYIDARPETRSEIVAPMISKGVAIGAFNVESDRPHAYTPADLERMLAFTDQATVAVENARLYERSLVAQRYEDELSIAREIQLFFLPARAPEMPGLDLAGINIPSLEVGGDYYDFIEIADGHLGLTIGDVSGKGVAAGLIMASFRAALLAEIRNNYSISRILAKVNRLLCESTELDRFVTAIYGVLDLQTRRFTYSSAGHNPALLVRRNGTVEELGEGGTVLGAFPEATYAQSVRQLEFGDTLVLYTDGVTEATNDAGEMYDERLVDLVRELRTLSARQITREIEAAVRRFAGGQGLSDDLTLMVAQVRSE